MQKIKIMNKIFCKKQKYKYVLYAKGILCRYEYYKQYNFSSILGEIFDIDSHKWKIDSITMQYEMEGGGRILSKKEVRQEIRQIKR